MTEQQPESTQPVNVEINQAQPADPGDLIEPPAETDPAPLINDDATEDLSSLPEGEDSDEDLDGDDDR